MITESSILFFLGAFFLTYIIVPKIINIVKFKKLLDKPNTRSSHSKMTPTLGGVAFFITLIFLLFFLKKWDNDNVINHITPSLTVLFIIGLKDDLISISPLTKIISQIIAIYFVLSNNSLVFTSFNGFLDIGEINYFSSLLMSSFFMIFIINSYNLIDGIDGLASLIGITIVSFLGIMFYCSELYFYFFLCLITAGTLFSFLFFNFSDKKKIFMGDTGSMIIGFIIGLLILKLISTKNTPLLTSIKINSENLIAILISIISIPLFDTIRVFLIRIFSGKSFFVADNNHIHHIFLSMKMSHKKTTFIITIINITFISFTYVLNLWFKSYVLIVFQITFLSSLALMLFFMKNKKKYIRNNEISYKKNKLHKYFYKS